MLEKNTECEKELFKNIKKYFKNKKDPTCRDLLEALFSLYKQEYINKKLYFHKFINMFEKSTINESNFKRQHVFEAICKLLLLFDYDKGELGKKKKFYTSLEDLIKNPNPKDSQLEDSDILNSKINGGSEAGVVDILFVSEYQKDNLCNDDWMCDCNPIRSKRREKFNKHYNISRPPIDKQYIMIQNKYYSEEKADIEKYDVSKIYTKADKMSKLNNNFTKKIILMVNNEDSLQEKIKRSRNINKRLIDKIYGVKTLEDWFKMMLNDFDKYLSIDEYIKNMKNNKNKNNLYSRFHQKLITNSTKEYYEKEGYRLFIWGAVPRSGKSYMIADMILKRSHTDNNIVIILGAKSETECQFVKMFKTYSDFEEYGIINNNTKCKGNTEKNKNIYIFSQEFFKVDKIVNNNFTDKFYKNKDYKSLFNKGKIDLYFDEIHKGGTTDKSQQILSSFNNSNINIELFVMVTATFAKPRIKYNTNFIDVNDKKTKLLEWSYEDQQNMKNLVNQTQKQIIINSRENLEQEVIKQIFDDYEKEYGDKYLEIISKDYQKHPELVILQPDIQIDIKKVFNLKCSGCKKEQTLYDFMNTDNIFEQSDRVDELLKEQNLGNVYEQLFNMEAPLGNTKNEPHSELWFLPDKNLYPEKLNCKDICNEIQYESNNDEDNNTIKGIPNIEPLTRGLSLMLVRNKYFRNNYNVAIVHNSTPNYKIYDSNNKKLSIEQVYNKFEDKGIKILTKSDNIGLDIKNYETITYSQRKSLIILTGGKLRLGISLPCVDIAFNFDSISSIDNNYQTMFRVLTERYIRPKKYGYYVDFNKERTIQFIYQFNKIYGIGKKIPNIKENVEYLKSLLVMFNFNGLGIIKQSAEKEIKLYNSLIKKLEINEDKYMEFYMNNDNIVNLIKKTLYVGNIDTDTLKEMKTFKFDKKNKINNIKEILKKGNKDKQDLVDDEDDNEEKEDEDDDDEDDLFTNFSEIIKELSFLFALFSNKSYYNCETLEECIMNCYRNIDKFSELCKCGQENDIYTCHMSDKSYNKKQLKKLLQIFLKMLENAELKNVLKFIFNTLKTRMTKDMTTDGSLKKENNSLIYDMSDRDIINMIKEYLPIRQKEKKEFGEAFTPKELIDDMLDKLPEDVWYDPNLKWLDPANGIGNFPMVVYSRLMESLKNIRGLKDKKKRHDHIIGNMLYMVELNPRNVEISKRIFGKEANIYCGDFLEEKWDGKFEVNKFDIIIGNPPFQIKGASGDNKAYLLFTSKSLKFLTVDSGFLLFISPPNILEYLINFESKNRKYINEYYNLKYIAIQTPNKYFNVGSNFCFFLLKNEIVSKSKTKIEYLEKTKQLSEIDIIPNKIYPFNLFNKKSISIINKVNNIREKFDIKNMKYVGKNKFLRIRKEHINKKIVDVKKDDMYKYLVIDKINLHNPTGLKYYIKEKLEDYDNLKIIFSKVGYLHPTILKNGSISDNLLYMNIDNKSEYESFKSILDSKLFKSLCKMYLLSGMDYWKVLLMLPKIELNKIYSNDDIYNMFNFNDEEINYIESL